MIESEAPKILAELKQYDRPRRRDLFCRRVVAAFCADGVIMANDFVDELSHVVDYLRRRVLSHECRKVESIHTRRDGHLIWIIVHVWV